MQFYSPAYILAPSTITTTAVSLAASNLFYKQADFAASAPTPTSRSAANAQHQFSWNSGQANGGTGECVSLLPHFVQLALSNSHYGFLNSQNNYNYNLTELILNQQQLMLGGGGVNSLSLLANGLSQTASSLGMSVSGSGSASGSGSGAGSSSQSQANANNA